jgi:hypothetical protein
VASMRRRSAALTAPLNHRNTSSHLPTASASGVPWLTKRKGYSAGVGFIAMTSLGATGLVQARGPVQRRRRRRGG